tara:strand:- start:985 stop:1494 length:510 start_codon:yes stop_codon:yes gene_type:complete
METNVFNAIGVSLVSGLLLLVLNLIIWQWLDPEKKGIFLISGIAITSYGLTTWMCKIFFDLPPQVHICTSCPFFMLLLMGYLHLYVAIERSVSIRILGELALAIENKLTLENLHEIYSHDYMIRHRVNLMAQTNWLIKRDGKYVCTSKGKFLSQAAMFLKNCYGMKVTG